MKFDPLLVVLACLLVSGCVNSPEAITEQEQVIEFNKKNSIVYEYKGVYVTRTDEGTESRFYYGNYKDSTHLSGSYVKSTFHGFNSGMDAWLIFTPNLVEVLYTMDYFENVGDTQQLKVITNTTASTFYTDFEDKARGHYDNVCRVSDILTREQELNASNRSKVRASYPAE